MRTLNPPPSSLIPAPEVTLARLTLRLISLVTRISDEVEPTNTIRRRDHLGRDDRPRRLSHVACVGEVACGGLQDRSNASEEGCERSKKGAAERGRREEGEKISSASLERCSGCF
jgi:hypothetical protein